MSCYDQTSNTEGKGVRCDKGKGVRCDKGKGKGVRCDKGKGKGNDEHAARDADAPPDDDEGDADAPPDDDEESDSAASSDPPSGPEIGEHMRMLKRRRRVDFEQAVAWRKAHKVRRRVSRFLATHSA